MFSKNKSANRVEKAIASRLASRITSRKESLADKKKKAASANRINEEMINRKGGEIGFQIVDLLKNSIGLPKG